MYPTSGLRVDSLATLDALVIWGYMAYGWLGPVAPTYGLCALGMEKRDEVLDVRSIPGSWWETLDTALWGSTFDGSRGLFSVELGRVCIEGVFDTDLSSSADARGVEKTFSAAVRVLLVGVGELGEELAESPRDSRA